MEPGNRIKQIRDELGMSQETLGQNAGLFQEAVGRMERRKRSRNVEVWIRVARAMGKTVEEIYHLPSEETASTCQK